MRFLKIVVLSLVVILGIGTVGSRAAELSVPYEAHRAYSTHVVRYAWVVPDGFYYPPYGFWQHAPWGFNWHNWGMRPWDGTW
jgi:hypothetical protein